MNLRFLFTIFIGLLLVTCTLSTNALAEDKPVFVPNKLLCARMIRFGKEAYQRGRFQDAKEFFRRATIADPESKTAWRLYDQSVLFALAEKVEKKENSDLLSPGTSVGYRIQSFDNQSTSQSQTIDTPAIEQFPQVATPIEEAVTDDLEPEELEEEEGC